MRSRKLLFSFFLLTLAGPGALRAEELTATEQNLVARYMQMHKGPRDLAVGIWFPEPIWDSLASAAAGASPGAALSAQEVLLLQKFLRPYTLVGLIYARQKGGEVRPRPEAWVRKKVRLVGPDGRSYKALTPDRLPAELHQTLQGFRFGLASTQPGLADYTYFLAFPNVDRQGRLLVDSRREGAFTIKIGDANLLWTTPLDPEPRPALPAGAVPQPL
ncbi:MAG: hypothetical protein IPP68_00565 [Elusimicrobia bacterium]|nr:hypothetical protein [Elusimicrobiota bacterium]